jgi:hypothetical protein
VGELRFYLGAHHPHWLRSAGVPLFVSRRALGRLKTLPRATTPWALDSGGFSELQLHGGWTLSASDYAAEVRRYREEIGLLEWAAPQDWMCEQTMLARTGLTVEEHQRRTIANYLELRALAPDVPWIPVLQGWTSGDYHRHVDAYSAAGVDLARLPLVGVGTVCRRQNTAAVGAVLACLAFDGLRLHAFGFKLRGLERSAEVLASADSMAWSYSARRNPALPGHTHKNCANCLEYALMWREDALSAIARGTRQLHLPVPSCPTEDA